MASTDVILQELDRQFETLIQQNADLSQLPIADWSVFAKGYAARNVLRTEARRTRWMAAEKIYCACWGLDWDLVRLIECGYLVFSYDHTQKNLSLLSLLKRLEAASVIYLAEQEAIRTEANKTAEAGEPVQSLVQKYYDDWGDWVEGYTRRPCEWDITRVNGINQSLTSLILYLSLFEAEAETGTDTHGYAALVAEALPVIQAFQTSFPNFCALLNDANVLDLTEKTIVHEPTTLNLVLPEAAAADRSLAARPIAQVQADKSTDFQGFAVFLVLEPRSAAEIAEDKRDLHGNFISKEEIRKSALHWSIHGRKTRLEHDPATETLVHENPDWVCVFNWIQYGDAVIGSRLVKDGTWLQAWQAMTDEAKTKLENYEINGLSPGGMATFWRDPEPKED